VHLQKAYAYLGLRRADFPVSEKLADQVISLPLYPYMSQKEILYVVAAVKEALERA
jgi:dTDP-4-amino-4,6-dideoxygalactose transaminase